MKLIKFEGTSEEFKTIAFLFDQKDSITSTQPYSSGYQPVEAKDAIRAVLKRRSIPENQVAIYRALANGEIAYDKLLQVTGKSREEQAGILGALGARIKGTEEVRLAGLPEGIKAIIDYREVSGVTYLSLTEHAQIALKEEGII